MQTNDMKEVWFDVYCQVCKYKTKPEDDKTCDRCLHETVNKYSHKPVKYEEDF